MKDLLTIAAHDLKDDISSTSSKIIPATGSVICGTLAIGINIANIYEDYHIFLIDRDIVKGAINTSTVVGATTIGGIYGNSVCGKIGIGYGMLFGSITGTVIKRKNMF
jgi:hypothetical protein